MDWDDVRPAPERRIVVGEPLRALSISDLKLRVTACEAEIVRITGEIASREAHESEAAKLFKR
jgi:uncharacterized small protein (DUF1192 family)